MQYMSPSDLKDAIPYVIGLLATIIALKKDWIKSKFANEVSKEELEALQLNNIEKTVSIYRTAVDDLNKTVLELKDEIYNLKTEVKELKGFIEEQKTFIKKQSESLKYYEGKYGKITK